MGLEGFPVTSSSHEVDFLLKQNSSVTLQKLFFKNGMATCLQLGKVCRCLVTAGGCGDQLSITRQLHRLHGGRQPVSKQLQSEHQKDWQRFESNLHLIHKCKHIQHTVINPSQKLICNMSLTVTQCNWLPTGCILVTDAHFAFSLRFWLDSESKQVL